MNKYASEKQCLDIDYLMIMLLEKVAPVPLFTDNFLRIFTIRRYHPRCKKPHMIFVEFSNAVLDD